MSDITEEQYRKLKREVEEAKSNADRASGALEQLMTRLKDEFDCGSVKEAKAKLAELSSKQATAKQAFDSALEEYEERWKA